MANGVSGSIFPIFLSHPLRELNPDLQYLATQLPVRLTQFDTMLGLKIPFVAPMVCNSWPNLGDLFGTLVDFGILLPSLKMVHMMQFS